MYNISMRGLERNMFSEKKGKTDLADFKKNIGWTILPIFI